MILCPVVFKQGLCINLEGLDVAGDGREFQKGGDICIPLADSCWGVTENKKFCKAIILQQQQIKNKKVIKNRSSSKKEKYCWHYAYPDHLA